LFHTDSGNLSTIYSSLYSLYSAGFSIVDTRHATVVTGIIYAFKSIILNTVGSPPEKNLPGFKVIFRFIKKPPKNTIHSSSEYTRATDITASIFRIKFLLARLF
jgi:hypothetical protein